MEQMRQQESAFTKTDPRNDQQQNGCPHHHQRHTPTTIQTPRLSREMHPLPVRVHIIPILHDHPIDNRPRQATQLLGFIFPGLPKVQLHLVTQPQTLMVILIARIQGDHQSAILIRPGDLTVEILFDDFGADGNRNRYSHCMPPFIRCFTKEKYNTHLVKLFQLLRPFSK